MKRFAVLGFLALLVAFAPAARAVGICNVSDSGLLLLDFEGVGDLAPVNGFYGDCGVDFSANALGIIDWDAGGSGNFANEPSPSTILFWLSGAATSLSVPDGFHTALSLYYSAIVYPGVLRVYSGVEGSGDVLATIRLPLTPRGPGDPNGAYAVWQKRIIVLPPTAEAKSIGFAGTADYIGFDDVRIPTADAADIDSDGDGLPDYYEETYNGECGALDPEKAGVPDVLEDADGDGLDWLEEYAAGCDPCMADTDSDGILDEDEGEGACSVNESDLGDFAITAFPGSNFGTAYFEFTVTSPPADLTGFRVFYGPESGDLPEDYVAHFDLPAASRSGYVDQAWGLQGSPMVFLRVAAMRGGEIAALSNEAATYFGGQEDGKLGIVAEDSNADQGDKTETTSESSNGPCFIGTASAGSGSSAAWWLVLAGVLAVGAQLLGGKRSGE